MKQKRIASLWLRSLRSTVLMCMVLENMKYDPVINLSIKLCCRRRVNRAGIMRDWLAGLACYKPAGRRLYSHLGLRHGASTLTQWRQHTRRGGKSRHSLLERQIISFHLKHYGGTNKKSQK